MIRYKYVAKDLGSKTVRGTQEAMDERQLATQLRSQDLFLIRSKNLETQELGSYKFKANELSDFSRQIGTMLGSGISLVRALNIMLQRDLKDNIKKVYQNVYHALQQGNALSDAMAAQKRAFPELMINMFRAGESSGQLEKTAMKMAEHYEKEHRLHNKIRSASTYPIILAILTVLITIAIFAFVLPSFFDLFVGVDLPAATKAVIAISNSITQYWYIYLLVILCAIALCSLLLRFERVVIWRDHLKLRLPKIGPLMKTICTARFARTLCSLYTSGVSMINALRIVAGTVNNKYITSQFDNIVREVRNGLPLSSAIKMVDGFDAKLASTIFVGEESGRLDDMLESIADSFDYEAEEATQRLVSVLEPLLIVIMAFIIGFVIISVMIPLYTLYNNVGTMV